MKQCSNCGNWCDDHAQFCNNCGSPMGQQDNTQGNTSQGNMNQGNMQGNGNPWGPTGNPAGIFVRSIPLSIVGRIDPVEYVGVSWQRNGNVRNINHPLCGCATIVIQKNTFPL